VELLREIVSNGDPAGPFPSLEEIRAHRVEQLSQLHESHKRLHNAHEYKVGLTQMLWLEKEQMMNRELR
jgi:hypothetical protein